jgi:hypothetical protein
VNTHLVLSRIYSAHHRFSYPLERRCGLIEDETEYRYVDGDILILRFHHAFVSVATLAHSWSRLRSPTHLGKIAL